MPEPKPLTSIPGASFLVNNKENNLSRKESQKKCVPCDEFLLIMKEQLFYFLIEVEQRIKPNNKNH